MYCKQKRKQGASKLKEKKMTIHLLKVAPGELNVVLLLMMEVWQIEDIYGKHTDEYKGCQEKWEDCKVYQRCSCTWFELQSTCQLAWLRKW